MLACQQELASFLQSGLFLISDGSEAGHRQKMTMQACTAHAACIAQRINAKPGIVMVADPGNGPPDAAQCAIGLRNLTQQPSLGALKETIEQLPLEQGAENRDIGRRVEYSCCLFFANDGRAIDLSASAVMVSKNRAIFWR